MEESFIKQPDNPNEKRIVPNFDYGEYRQYIEDGIESGLERKHRGMFLKFTHKSYCNAVLAGEQKEVVDFEMYIKMARVAEDLLGSFGKNFKTAESDQIKGLANVSAHYLNSHTPLYCFSIASNAIQDGDLKDKDKQYKKFDLIQEVIADVFIGFHTTKERAFFQMGLYSVTGKIFENKYPTAIQFDVQKKFTLMSNLFTKKIG